jgi:hypothetical protein
VVHQGREGEADLARDLRVHVQGGVGIAPRLQRQRRPDAVGRIGQRHDGPPFIAQTGKQTTFTLPAPCERAGCRRSLRPRRRRRA